MKKFKKLCFLLLTFVFVIGCTMTTFAATPKKIKATSNYKTVLTKTGSYKLTNMKDYQIGGVRFKAPKAGYYTITFSDLLYDGEIEDSESAEYWEETGNDSTYKNSTVSISLMEGNDKSGWSCIYFDDDASFWLYNPHNVFYHMWLYGDYDNIEEAAAACVSGELTDQEITDMLQGGGAEWKFTVKLKKGQIIRLQTQGVTYKTTCDLKIKYSSKE